MDKLDDMLLFAKVVRLKSFRAVALSQNIASSVVSKRIARLERNLGVQLLVRTTRKLTLTEAGVEFYSHCQRIENSVALAESSVTQHIEKPTGTLKIAAPMVSGQFFLPAIIEEYVSTYPDMKVDLTLKDRFDDLIDSGYDLAIRTGTLADSSLKARQLVNSRWGAFASPAYLKRLGSPNTTQELEAHNCLQFAYQETGANEWPINAADQKNDHSKVETLKIDGNYKASSLLALREAAISGLGIAFLPCYLVRDQVASSQLKPVLPDTIRRDVGIYAIYPNTRFVPRKLSAFIELLVLYYNRACDQFS